MACPRRCGTDELDSEHRHPEARLPLALSMYRCASHLAEHCGSDYLVTIIIKKNRLNIHTHANKQQYIGVFKQGHMEYFLLGS